MKKMLVAVLLFMILISGARYQQEFSLLNYFSGDYYVYTNEKLNESSINLGSCYMNRERPKETKIKGESMIVKNFEPSSAINLLDAKVVETEYLEDGTIVIYAYTNLIDEKVKIGNNYVNLQIAYKEEYSVIGWPLILGSF